VDVNGDGGTLMGMVES